MYGIRCITQYAILTKWNDDIGTNLLLSLHRTLGCQQELGSISVTPKDHPLFGYLNRILAHGCIVVVLLALGIGTFQFSLTGQLLVDAAVRQRKNLKPSRICYKGTVSSSIGELMNPTRLLDEVSTWVQHQVIRVGKDELLSRLVGISKIQTLQSCIGRYSDVSRCVNDTMRCMDSTDAGLTFRRLVDNLEPKEITVLVGPGWKVVRSGKRWSTDLGLGLGRR